MSGLPSSAWTISTSALRQRQDLLLDQRVAVGRLDEPVDGLVEDGAVAEDGLEDAARRLAGPEAGDPRPRREGADASPTAGSRRSAGTSTSRMMELLGAGVAVTCIAGEV